MPRGSGCVCAGKSGPVLVSVIIPTHNRAHFVGRAIQSVLKQTFQDFEIIVVDDGSTDGTAQVVTSIDDDRLTYVLHEKNLGSNAARNTGIRIAHGKYIAFQDSDDESHPDKLERLVGVLEDNPDVGVVYSAFWRIKDGVQSYFPFPSCQPREGDIHESLLYGNFVNTQALMRADVLRRVEGFDESIPRLQDWELMLRLSRICLFRFIEEPLFTAHYTNDSISADSSALVDALKSILSTYHDEFDKHPKAKALQYFTIGKTLCMEECSKGTREYFLWALRTAPRAKYLLALIAASTLGRQGVLTLLKIYGALRKLVMRR